MAALSTRKSALRRHLEAKRSISHITRHSGISIDPPSASNARLTIKDSKLVESKLLFQSAAHCNARLSCTDNDDRVIFVATRAIGILSLDRCEGHPEQLLRIRTLASVRRHRRLSTLMFDDFRPERTVYLSMRGITKESLFWPRDQHVTLVRTSRLWWVVSAYLPYRAANSPDCATTNNKKRTASR